MRGTELMAHLGERAALPPCEIKKRLSQSQKTRHRKHLRAWHNGYRYAVSLVSACPPPGLGGMTQEEDAECKHAEMTCQEFYEAAQCTRACLPARTDTQWSCRYTGKYERAVCSLKWQKPLGMHITDKLKVIGVVTASQADLAAVRSGWHLRRVGSHRVTTMRELAYVRDILRHSCNSSGTDEIVNYEFCYLAKVCMDIEGIAQWHESDDAGSCSVPLMLTPGFARCARCSRDARLSFFGQCALCSE